MRTMTTGEGSPDTAMSTRELELATLIVGALNLEDIDPHTLSPEAPLFLTEDDGLGLDSIDALEIALAVNEHFGVEIRVGEEDADEEALRAVFRSVRSLMRYIEAEQLAGQRETSGGS